MSDPHNDWLQPVSVRYTNPSMLWVVWMLWNNETRLGEPALPKDNRSTWNSWIEPAELELCPYWRHCFANKQFLKTCKHVHSFFWWVFHRCACWLFFRLKKRGKKCSSSKSNSPCVLCCTICCWKHLLSSVISAKGSKAFTSAKALPVASNRANDALGSHWLSQGCLIWGISCHVDGEALMKPREIVETNEMGTCFSNLGMVLNEKKDGFVMDFSWMGGILKPYP